MGQMSQETMRETRRETRRQGAASGALLLPGAINQTVCRAGGVGGLRQEIFGGRQGDQGGSPTTASTARMAPVATTHTLEPTPSNPLPQRCTGAGVKAIAPAKISQVTGALVHLAPSKHGAATGQELVREVVIFVIFVGVGSKRIGDRGCRRRRRRPPWLRHLLLKW